MPPILNELNLLRSMNEMQCSNTSWGKEIGFMIDPHETPPVKSDEYHKAKLFEECSFTTQDGSELACYKPPNYGCACQNVSHDAPLLDFAIIDSNMIPIRCCASVMLQNYVVAHIGYEDSKIWPI